MRLHELQPVAGMKLRRINHHSYIMWPENGGPIRIGYDLTTEDILADDWEIVQPTVDFMTAWKHMKAGGKARPSFFKNTSYCSINSVGYLTQTCDERAEMSAVRLCADHIDGEWVLLSRTNNL